MGFVKKIQPLEIWSIFLISALMIPLLATIFPFLNINVGTNFGGFVSLGIFFLIILALAFQTKPTSLKKMLTLQNFLLFSIVSLISLVKAIVLFYFLRNLITPILHDPVDHSMWAKSIITQEKIAFFYSPLLHSLAATLSMGNINEIPRLIVAVTHLSVFMLPIQFSLLFYYFTKKPTLAVFVFVLLSSLHFPANQYFMTGKNSLILALSIIPVCIFSLHRLFSNPIPWSGVRVFISLSLLFLAHYPTFGIFVYLVIPWTLIHFYTLLKTRELKKILFSLSPLVLTVLFAVAWFLPLYGMQNELATNTVGSGATQSRESITYNLLIKNLSFFYEDYLNRYFNPLYLFVLVPIFSKLGNLKIKSSLVWMFSSLFTLYTIIYTLQFEWVLGMVSNTMEIIYPTIMLLVMIFLIAYILLTLRVQNKLLLFSIVCISIFSIISNYYLFKNITSRQERFNVVDTDDMQAFEFINKNIPAGSIFLNGAQQSVDRKEIIFPVDGALWLPLFTDSKVIFDFSQMSSVTTHESYRLFNTLKTESDDLPIVEEFKDIGVKYGYIDKGVFGESLHEDFLNSIEYTVLFESGPVKIIEFK